MKKIMVLFLSLFMISALAACGSQNSGNDNSAVQSAGESTPRPTQEAPTEGAPTGAPEEPAEPARGELAESTQGAPTEAPAEPTQEAPEASAGKILVVYFSATGNTEEAANYIAEAAGADVFELVPAEPYSDDDLNWMDGGSRVVYEHDNPDARAVELAAATVSDWEAYDTVFIGYPIWWGIAAWPVDGFIAANDFTGKTVIPFCTSASSELGESGELLAQAAGTGEWLEGMRFSSGVSKEAVQSWVDSLGL